MYMALDNIRMDNATDDSYRCNFAAHFVHSIGIVYEELT